MNRFTLSIAAAATALSFAAQAFAGEQYVDGTGYAASGYDVVAYFDLPQSAVGQSQPKGVPGNDADTNVIRYFNEANPLFPDWPPAMSHIDSAVFLVIMYAMLLTPKIAGAAIIAATPPATRVFGGRGAFLAAFTTEVLLSIAYAPIMMIQQTKAVLRATFTRSEPWSPQTRDAQHYPLATLLKFHWLETVLGLILISGLASGLVSMWLLPIALSLILAVPLSALSALNIAKHLPRSIAMNSPHTLREPAIVTRAKTARAQIKSQLKLDILAE